MCVVSAAGIEWERGAVCGCVAVCVFLGFLGESTGLIMGVAARDRRGEARAGPKCSDLTSNEEDGGHNVVNNEQIRKTDPQSQSSIMQVKKSHVEDEDTYYRAPLVS
jgi:hypothetical protein